MSELSGIDAAKAIWQEQAVPIIFVSAFADRKEQTRTTDSDHHAAAFLLKPIKRQDLEAAIHKVTGQG
jgi:two-component SAPR family response regulator